MPDYGSRTYQMTILEEDHLQSTAGRSLHPLINGDSTIIPAMDSLCTDL